MSRFGIEISAASALFSISLYFRCMNPVVQDWHLLIHWSTMKQSVYSSFTFDIQLVRTQSSCRFTDSGYRSVSGKAPLEGYTLYWS